MVIGQFVEVIDNIPAKLLIRANWEFPKLSFFGEGYMRIFVGHKLNLVREEISEGERLPSCLIFEAILPSDGILKEIKLVLIWTRSAGIIDEHTQASYVDGIINSYEITWPIDDDD
jgi:hypothetical protein